ncbi:MAG: MMPL family transporter [Planctomycetota bacterium]|jgi:hopanoid biosynthesis associated RND transporter like protein HpnN
MSSSRHRLFLSLANLVTRNALLIVIVGVALAGASTVFTVLNIEFITDRNALVDPKADFNKRFLEFNQGFGDQELMMLLIGPAPGPVGNGDYDPDIPDETTREQMRQAATRIVEKLKARPELFPAVYDRVRPEDFKGTALLFAPESDLEEIHKTVQASAPVIDRVAQDPRYPSLILGIRDTFDQGETEVPDEEVLKKSGEDLEKFLRGMRESLSGSSGSSPSPLMEFKSSDPSIDPEGWMMLWDGRLLLVPILPDKDFGALNQVKEPLGFAREVVSEVESDYPELSIGLTGRPVIYSDEMETSSRDMTFATIIAIFAVGLMFILAFKSVVRPLLAVASLVLALAWTFGATTLVIGHLNIFAMVFSVVLVGLGIDFGIHILAHYRDGLARGLSVHDSLRMVYTECGSATVVGAFSTAAALTTAALTDFVGLAELGIICGMGITFCLISMLFVFPALLVLVDGRRLKDRTDVEDVHADSGKNQDVDRPATSKGAKGMATVVSLLGLGGLVLAGVSLWGGWAPFSYNLLALTDPSGAGVHWENLLVKHDQRSSYVVSLRGDADELEALRKQYEPLVESGVIRSLESLHPANEHGIRASLGQIDSSLPATFAVASEPSTAGELRSACRRLQSALREVSTRGHKYEQAFGPALGELSALVELTRSDAEFLDGRIRETEARFFSPMVDGLQLLKANSDPPELTADNVPETLRNRFVGTNAQGQTVHALYVYPSDNVWVHERAAEFNRAICEIDPEATGVTIQVYESGNLIVRGFLLCVLFAAIAMVLLLAIDLRRPLAVMIALLPCVGALSVLLGVMWLTGLDFNFANFFGVPILIGTLVDAGVYLVHSQRHGDAIRTLIQTRRACVLCGLTTLLGFGSLSFASHQGITSLGLVLVIGCTSGLFFSTFVVPVILSKLNASGRRI